jgi:hypothetical protein
MSSNAKSSLSPIWSRTVPDRQIPPGSAILDDDVAQVDANPEDDPLLFWNRGVALGHPTLHGDRAGDRLNDTRELDQDAVARGLDDAALVLSDLWIDQLATMGSEPRDSANLVLTHEASVADDIGGEYGREPAFDPLFAQGSLPPAAHTSSGRRAIA